MMTNAFPQLLKELLHRPYKECEMESLDLLPGVQCNASEVRGTVVWDGSVRSVPPAKCLAIVRAAARAAEVNVRYGTRGWAGPLPVLSVISSSSRSNSPRSPHWSDTLSTTNDIAANYSNILKINDNKNNMQSVKISLVVDFTNNFEHKGIANNDCLISDISLILCVPKLMNRINCYSDINPNIMERKNDRVIATDTNKFGAFPQWWEIQSQSISKTVDNNCDFNVFVKCILINQIVGDAPNDSIPVTKNAITVQGIKYGHPHSNSFNPNLMYRGDEVSSLPTNKSDYAFIHTTRIISNHSVFHESETVSTQNLALKVEEEETLVIPEIQSVLLENQLFGSNTPSSSIRDNPGISSERNQEWSKEETSGDTKSSADSQIKPKFSTFKNGDFTFASLLEMVQQAPSKIATLLEQGQGGRWGIPSILRLAGGGESSLNTPSGWGSPPGANNNGNTNWGSGSGAAVGGAGGAAQQQWGAASQRPPVTQPDGNSNKMGGNGVPGSNGGGANSSVSGAGVVGGWGGGVPPPPSSQPSAQPLAPGGGSGGGSPGGGNPGGVGAPGAGVATPAPPAPTAKAQLEQLNTMRESLFSLDGWGGQHVNQDTNWDVPTSPEPGVKMDQPGGGPPPVWKPNINNGTDLWEANLRNGGQPPPQPVAKTPWGHTPTSNIGGTWGEDDDTPESSNVWNGPPPPQQWGGPPQQPPHWSAPTKKDDWGGWGEPHRPDLHRPDLHRPDLHRAPVQDPRDMRTLMGDMRGDPRGISGRLNGTADMWGQHHMPHTMQPQKSMMPSNVGNGVNQWGAQGPKDMGMSKGSSGWEEPSPPAARRNMPNFDDGTSLWGQQRGGGVGMAPWKEMSGGMGRGAMQCPPGMPPNRMPGVAPNPMKPDAMWGHPHRNGSWEDGSGHAGNWEKENSWNESPMNQSGAWPGGPKTKPMGGPGGSWDSDMGDWCGPKPPGAGPPAKLLPKDMVWNSKQFRLLVDMGYKKDDVELALRNRDMNVEEAMDLLSQMRGGGGMDTWRRHEEHPGGPPFEHQQQYPAPPRPHHSFPPQQPPSVPFPQPSQGLSSINNISPALVQKILSQPTSQPPPPFNQQNNQSGGGGQPSTAQLRMLVQQIQMAVSAGYLNHQILNQPLAPQTLVLLNQLLQQIKVLQQLASQQGVMQNSLGSKGSTSAVLHITVQITKTKQQISSLQNQISAQQAIYVKQQPGGGGSSGSSGGDFFNKQHDPLAQLQNNFADIALNKDPPSSYGSGGGQQSRLNQWKLPSLDKEGDGSEFSRAPGTTSKPTTSPQLNPLNLQPDNTWSTGRSVSDGWPSDTSDLPDGKEAWPSSQQHSSAASNYSDLVPEFEPGKPWKGHQMKSIEDDPAITPGSVVRSPLSLAAIKEPDGLGGAGKASPTTPSERSLSSSTWSYPPPPASTPSSSLGLGKAELWGGKLGGARAPPGLPGSKGPAPPSAPGSWAAPAPPRSQPYPHQPSWPSTWLLLKNLTAQIDGSTLKTLCMQHGPLQSFHLYLNQGIALAKYNTREEANKAQTALNNCVLSNTTIFAESPAESDVNMILQHLGQGGGGGGQWRGGTSGAPKDSWAFPSLWTETDQRATPSSLSSFLPPDLLGGESM